MKTFRDLDIREDILEAIEKKGYEKPSPIQERVIPLFINSDKDIIWQAQTWTGKTAAFGIPLLQLIDPKSKGIKAIVLCPTRELAIQVADEINSFSPNKSLNTTLLYGWNPIRNEIRELKNNPQLVIWTPGRVIDHLKKGRLNLENLEYFVLDEADEMLNIGFREEIEEILASAPKERRTLLFSATMPKAIMNIVKNYMGAYDLISVKKENLTNSSIDQKYFEVSRDQKFEALTRIIETEDNFYSIIFCRTKMDVDELASGLSAKWYNAEGIHWDIEQKMREKVLARFKAKKSNILVATDVAARWIDVNDITHVVNYSIPENAETYTHRIGRTWRAWKEGVAITFVNRAERRKIFYFENVIKAKIKKHSLPSVSEIIESKKVHLIESIKEISKWENWKKYIELAKSLLAVEEDVETLISSLLEKFYGKDLDKENYVELRTRVWSDRGLTWEAWMIRLFIAKWRNAKYDNPGKILDFIWTETWIEMTNAGKIDIFDNFSFMDMPEYEAEIILQVFKEKNKRQPLVVKAKQRWNGGGWGRWFSRWRDNRWGFRRGGWDRNSRWRNRR